YLGAFLFWIGFGFLMGFIAAGTGALDDLNPVFQEIWNAQDAILIGDARLASGILFGSITNAFKGGLDFFPLLLAVLFLCGGAIVMFWRPLFVLIGFISRKIGQASAKRKSQKEIEKQRAEALARFEEEKASMAANGLSYGANHDGSPNNSPFGAPQLTFNPEAQNIIQEEPARAPVQETPLPSRAADNHSRPASQYPTPKEVETPYERPSSFSSSNMSRSGLRAAVFSFDSGVPETPKPKPAAITPEPKKEPAKPVSFAVPNEVKEPLEEPIAPTYGESIISAPIEPEPEPTRVEEPIPAFEAPEEPLAGGHAAYEEEPLPYVSEPVEPIAPEYPAYEENEPEPEPAPVPVVNVVKEPEPAPEPEPDPTPELSPFERKLRELHAEKATPLPDYTFPGLDLLKTYSNDQNAEQIQADCQNTVNIINQTFANLGVGAQAVGFTVGPSVTRYDIQPDTGVSVSSIGRYMKDISMRLNGVAVRFEEVVRGKVTSGLEIANLKTTIVSLKEMIESMPTDPSANMYVPFGMNISGECICSDLSKFPHLLVSGTTGSGKSIFMHGLIMSLIMRNRPEDCKIVLVDPKRVEMSKYKDLPHLLCPIIKEPSEAKVCMDKLIEEMERRYRLFELAEVRDIRAFNSFYAPKNGLKKLPFISVFIDEYADLSDTCKNIGEAVVRLAQKARAAGIHLVIATQRPSVQVITGVIKANIPVRVALSMSSAIDSQTIIGQGGAEDLVGHGDMLIDCSLIARNGLTRAQGCLVDDGEIEKVVSFINSQGLGTMYDDNFLDLVDHEAEAKAAEAAMPTVSRAELKAQSDEDFYNMVKEQVMATEYTSISKIQRQFGVGFPRAGKLFAMLQADGIVAMAPDSPSSSKGCKVLVHAPNELEDIKLGSDN
ncbi:MAG: hypothetical protein IKN69_02910, partial [Bacilli bacterium]|nr:hypothetical protein [Bacilli bacterium]